MTKKFYLSLSLLFLCVFGGALNAQILTENFDDITTLPGSGWVQTNMSSPLGGLGWFQGNPTSFNAFNGNTNSYIGSNYNATGDVGTISNWLLSPVRTFNNGDVITFYTRKADPDEYADRLQLRLSTAGASTNVGATATSVGDFTTLLLEINATQILGIYPTTWTQYTATISGLGGPISGRVALRYHVTNGGFLSTASDYIGIDNFVYTPASSLPANDNCSGAITIPVNSTCVPTIGDVANATQSIPGVLCSGATGSANDDVWFKFVATQTNANVSVTGSAEFDAVVEVFSNSCGSLISLGCTDLTLDGGTEQLLFSTLSVGSTYYVRVYDWYLGAPPTTSFSICVVSFVPCNLTIPANAIAETEVCGGDSNGGCNAAIPAYVDITCNQTRSGRAYAENDERDTDWYRFTLATDATITLTGSSEFPAQYFLIDNCTNLTTLASAFSASCGSSTITQSLAAGTYLLVVSVGNSEGGYFTGYPCSENMDYFFSYSVSTTAPTISPVGPIALCPGTTTTLTSTVGQSYSWTGGGSAQTLSVSMPGNYSVTITDSNGCSVSSVAVDVVASEIPSALISGMPANGGCSETNVTLQSNATAGSGTISSYQWYFNTSPIGGSNTPSYTATQTGSYYVMVTNSNSCTYSSPSVQVTIGALPTASINGESEFCANGTIDMIATAQGGAGNIISYQWSLGGEEIENAQTSSYIPTQTGEYTVTVSNSLGCSATSSAFLVTINELPEVSISGDDVICASTGADLTSNVAAGTGTVQSYQWMLNGEMIDGADNADYIALQSGDYTLLVFNSAGCSSVSDIFIVGDASPPSASFTYDVDNATVTFTNSSQEGIDYSWDFGDGSQSVSTMNAVHQYTASDDYIVTLTVTNDCGTDIFSQEISVIVIGIEEIQIASSLSIFPNPTKDVMFVNYKSSNGNKISWKMLDVTGREVMSVIENGSSQLVNKEINLSGLAKGSYTFVLIDGNSISQKVIVVQ